MIDLGELSVSSEYNNFISFGSEISYTPNAPLVKNKVFLSQDKERSFLVILKTELASFLTAFKRIGFSGSEIS